MDKQKKENLAKGKKFGSGQNPRLGGRPKNALADLKKMLQKKWIFK